MAGTSFTSLLQKSLARRAGLLASHTTTAVRLFAGQADGVDGLFLDLYGEAAVLILYEGRVPEWFLPEEEGAGVLEVLRPLGARAVYLKPFAKDRSRLGGQLPAVVTEPTPLAGEALAEWLLIREHQWELEIRPYDGLSTGLFLDQRENRLWVHDWSKEFLGNQGKPPAVLNTFAYTCAFSVAAAKGGAVATSVDVSGRYLDWGKRNFEHNQIQAEGHRFARMDTFEFLSYARRKGFMYDLIILDPPSFAAGNKKKGIKPWSSLEDYPDLIREAAGRLNPRGVIFASTNTQGLCLPGRFERVISQALPRTPKYLPLPAHPVDFPRDQDRFTARAFAI